MSRPLHRDHCALSGDIAIGSEAIAIDATRCRDRSHDGHRKLRLFPDGNDRPARLDVALTAPEINIDRVHALAKAILGDAEFDRPSQGALSFKIGRASIGGVEAKQSDIKMRIDSDGLAIDQLTIADFSGAALAVKGHIDTKTQSPRGAVTLDLDARSLDGIDGAGREIRSARGGEASSVWPGARRRSRCGRR